MEGIFGHPWFQRDLPEGALAMNGSYMQSAPNLDQVQQLLLGRVGVKPFLLLPAWPGHECILHTLGAQPGPGSWVCGCVGRLACC